MQNWTTFFRSTSIFVWKGWGALYYVITITIRAPVGAKKEKLFSFQRRMGWLCAPNQNKPSLEKKKNKSCLQREYGQKQRCHLESRVTTHDHPLSPKCPTSALSYPPAGNKVLPQVVMVCSCISKYDGFYLLIFLLSFFSSIFNHQSPYNAVFILKSSRHQSDFP